jgi:sugar O-acyltransferase (sialic acid O-acetyltransferase NeuD family)
VNNYISLIGVGGHSRVIFELAELNGLIVDGLFDDDVQKFNLSFGEKKIKGPIDVDLAGPLVIAIGNNKIRKQISGRVLKADWQTLIHPTAIISRNVVIGEGSVIMAGVIIQPGTRIGKHCIINTGACIDHDCFIEDFVHIAPNCSLAGGISVREGTFIGIGSSIIPNITIGSWTNVGAGSVVVSNQPDNCTTVGVPAKPIKFNNE